MTLAFDLVCSFDRNAWQCCVPGHKSAPNCIIKNITNSGSFTIFKSFEYFCLYLVWCVCVCFGSNGSYRKVDEQDDDEEEEEDDDEEEDGEQDGK